MARITPLPTSTPLEKLLTIPQVGEQLQVDVREVRRLIREECLPTVPVGANRRRVIPSSLARWIKEREEIGQGA